MWCLPKAIQLLSDLLNADELHNGNEVILPSLGSSSFMTGAPDVNLPDIWLLFCRIPDTRLDMDIKCFEEV